MSTTETTVASPARAPAHVPGAAGSRLVSLDVARGITMAAMILVNNPGTWGHIYWPLEHAEWNGWTPTDLIFPFFLFIVGVSLVFSSEARLSKGDSRTTLVLHTFRRAVIIFAIGLALNSLVDLLSSRGVRIPGVLQRIGICYFAASILYLYVRPRTRAWIVAVLLIGYWILMRFVPVPGLGVPGRDIPFLD